jgi:peptidyl-prolyl cis-trans isomerase C
MLKEKVLHSAPVLASVLCLLSGVLGCSQGSAEQSAPATGASTAAPAPSATSPAPKAASTPASTASAAPGAAAPAAAPAAPPINPEKLPAVVARVNGEEIKKDDLVKGVQQLQQRMPAGQAGDPSVYHQVLDAMIARTLLEQEAKVEGVTVTDAEVKQQVDTLRTQIGSPEAFKKELEKEGITEEQLLAEARKGFTVQKFIQSKIAPTVTVSDAEAKTFYDHNTDKLKRPERAHVRQITVKIPTNAKDEDKKKAKDKAEAVLARLKAGEDFGKLARENSDTPDGKEGGADAWIAKGQQGIPAVFETAAFGLKKANDLSPVIETPDGYHIILLLEHNDADVVPFTEVKERIASYLKERETQQKLHDRVDALRAKGKVQTYL